MTIETKNLTFTYPGTGFSLRGVDFSMGPGACAALTGSNGSGKTTLGKLLCGLLKPQGGAVLFDGEDTAKWSLGRRGQRIGYLFQEPARQLFAPTVLEDLMFTQELQGISPGEAEARAMALLARFELDSLARRSVLTLSRGEQQRLAICGLLLNKPEALVLDEPTTGLDARRKAILAGVIREVLRDGISVLLISHDAAFVKANAQREVRMEQLNQAPLASGAPDKSADSLGWIEGGSGEGAGGVHEN
ncbi:MAG: energy-coupling factor ABC transporter ATP-binding protein [Oscillospiraceae bacterium]|nr:energy-coupling factor ABC transporter ATP-binding protein [Oscillospiraceae bacterium]